MCDAQERGFRPLRTWCSWAPCSRKATAVMYRAGVSRPLAMFWSVEKQEPIQTIAPNYCLHRLRTEVFPAFTCGATAGHRQGSCFGVAVSALVRMARLILHAHRPDTESSVEWHRRSWRQSTSQLSEAWDVDTMRTVAGGTMGPLVRKEKRRRRRRGENPLWWHSAEGWSHTTAWQIGP